jgi:hypothetical protein
MRVLPVFFAFTLSAISIAAAHELATPPWVPHPMPQGAPYFTDRLMPHPVINLRFAIVNGRRVLFDPATGRIKHVLVP